MLLAGIGFIGLAVLLLVLTGALPGLAEDDTANLPQVPEVVPYKSATVETPTDLVDVGDGAPDFVLKDLDGNDVSLADLRGRPIIINFWATWCIPCRIEMPVLQMAYNEYQAYDLAMLAVNFDEPEQNVRSFFYEEMGLTFTPLLDKDGEVTDLYKVFNFPSTFFIGADGVVKAVHRGPLFEEQVDALLATIIPQQT